MKNIKLLVPIMVLSLINLGAFADGNKKHKPPHETKKECCDKKGGTYLNHKCTKNGQNICQHHHK